MHAHQQRIAHGQNANAGSKSSIACGPAGLPARQGRHSRRFSTTSALSVADELLGFFGAGKALRAGGGFCEVSRAGGRTPFSAGASVWSPAIIYTKTPVKFLMKSFEVKVTAIVKLPTYRIKVKSGHRRKDIILTLWRMSISYLSRNWRHNTLNTNELYERRLYHLRVEVPNASSLHKSQSCRLL